ncbi:MerR family transcriptional regulator [Crossiella sp. NPDC003009]
MLTISQLAATAGVTVRAVRHYHQVGLLPEPERDSSGYRRYPAQAAVDLIRIKTLAEAGVPLARIDALRHADPAEFAEAVADIDAELRRKMDQLAEHRRRIAALVSGDGLVLPPEVVANLDRMRALGVSEPTLRLERDTWILLRALDPEALPKWAADKKASFEDPETVRLFLRCDESLGWEPDDPRVEEFIEELYAWEVQRGHDVSEADQARFAFSRVAEASPTWQRIFAELDHRRRAAAAQAART